MFSGFGIFRVLGFFRFWGFEGFGLLRVWALEGFEVLRVSGFEGFGFHMVSGFLGLVRVSGSVLWGTRASDHTSLSMQTDS